MVDSRFAVVSGTQIFADVPVVLATFATRLFKLSFWVYKNGYFVGGETLILQIHLLNRSSCCLDLANLAVLKLFLSPLESTTVSNKNSDSAWDCRPF